MKKVFCFALSIGFAFSARAGFYLEFRIKGSFSGEGLLKCWVQDGQTRSQMQMNTPGDAGNRPTGAQDMRSMAMLYLKDQPEKMFMIDGKSKTYSEGGMRKGRNQNESEEESYEIKVLGKETINGYTCTHLKAVRNGGRRSREMEWWVSPDVKGYKELGEVSTRQFSTKAMYKAMSGMNMEGFPVKMKMDGPNPMEIELVKAEQMDIPESMFSLDGLTKVDAPPFMPGGMDMDKIKNMSPEERQKFFQEMQKMRGSPPGSEPKQD